MARAVLVLDVGKTHVKLLAVRPEGGDVLALRQAASPVATDGPYPHCDVETIWRWLLAALGELGRAFEPVAIVPTTCGSTAALVDEAGLVLPMLDYEAEGPNATGEAYVQAAPAFDACCAPINPAGLNLGRQLFWQRRAFPEAFARAQALLLAPQYWAWRLSGVMTCEVTSLSAQTHLWNPRTQAFTHLARAEGLDRLLPPLRRAYDVLGSLDFAVAAAAGLEARPPVLTGIHDSNANFTRYLAAGIEELTLVSSGTWLITFDTRLPLEQLDPAKDMVANTDLEGRPVACTRFMGGREFFELAGADGLQARPGEAEVLRLIEAGVMALPAFTDSGGPFPGMGGTGRIEGPAPEDPEGRAALAALYVALVTAVDLDLLDSKGQVVIDGSFAENRLFAGLLAALRPEQKVMTSQASDGTALGAALLFGWRERTTPVPLDLRPVTPAAIPGLAAYAAAWREAAGVQVV
jgi:sugar (pentulose or hexulose) kinase